MMTALAAYLAQTLIYLDVFSPFSLLIAEYMISLLIIDK